MKVLQNKKTKRYLGWGGSQMERPQNAMQIDETTPEGRSITILARISGYDLVEITETAKET